MHGRLTFDQLVYIPAKTEFNFVSEKLSLLDFDVIEGLHISRLDNAPTGNPLGQPRACCNPERIVRIAYYRLYGDQLGLNVEEFKGELTEEFKPGYAVIDFREMLKSGVFLPPNYQSVVANPE